ncbi:FGLLP motif-containing membrane protein [Streptomyces sp. NPDC002688]|uniref:FGLLP motif-containing membrane protein n=1 Tax=Streptomyces sp. NPDC002688 TaxID=3154423 RepID=UPI00331F5170
MRHAGRVRYRGVWGAVATVSVLVGTAVMPTVVGPSGGARAVADVTARHGPVRAPAQATPFGTSAVPQPTDTETEDTPSPQPPDPSLSPPFVKVERGETFTVTGTDFACSAEGDTAAGPLTFSVEGRAPVELSVDDTGTFEQRVVVPEDATPGVYGTTARCADVEGPTAQAEFEVVEPVRPRPRPEITLSPDSGAPSSPLTIDGTDFVCDEGSGVDLLWDGKFVAAGTPDENGSLNSSITVPSTAEEGRHEVTAACGSPAETRDTDTFTVEPREVVVTPSGVPHDVTLHITDHPVACTRGHIVIGGHRLDTWLDRDSFEGNVRPGHWEFIDLHAHLPDDLKGRLGVELTCAGRSRERAGEITLPTSEELTFFALPLGSTGHHEGDRGAITPPPTDRAGSPGPSPSASTSRGHPTGGASHSSGASGKPHHSEHEGPDDPAKGHDQADAGLVGSLHTPADVSWKLKDVAGSAAMAAWFLVLVLLLERAFPSQLADNALTRWWRRLRERRARRTGRSWRISTPGWVTMCGFALLGGSLAVWADAGTGWSGSTAIKIVGAAAGMLIILVAYEKTKDSLLHPARGPVTSQLKVIPAGLLLAVAMTAMSRVLEFPVPYVYGLVAVYIAAGVRPSGGGTRPGGTERGQAVLIGGICVLAAAVLVWVLGAPLIASARTEHAAPGSLPYVAAYAVGLAAVAGIEVVVFGLLPLSGMDGRHLKEWNKPAWYALYLTGLFFFFHVLLSTLHPGVGSDLVADADLRWCTVVVATGLFLLAWVLSLVLRWHVARVERQPAPAG